MKPSVTLLVRAKETRFGLSPQGESGLDGPPGPPGAVVSYSSRSTVQLHVKEGQALPGVSVFEFVFGLSSGSFWFHGTCRRSGSERLSGEMLIIHVSLYAMYSTSQNGKCVQTFDWYCMYFM